LLLDALLAAVVEVGAAIRAGERDSAGGLPLEVIEAVGLANGRRRRVVVDAFEPFGRCRGRPR
jgi:hypothetical protein